MRNQRPGCFYDMVEYEKKNFFLNIFVTIEEWIVVSEYEEGKKRVQKYTNYTMPF